MGIIWRSIMPLLSTLAALVIIVHSLEEEMDQEFRYHARSRGLMDTVTPHSEVWRPIDVESDRVHETTQQNVYYDNVSPEEQPKRRRPIRKRRRRPLHSAELEPQERRLKEELPTHYSEEEEIFQTTEQPRRRRKRPDIRPIRWVDEPLDEDRPLRRRTQRKKRPRQEMSEFNIHQENDDIAMNENHEHLSGDETHRFVDNEDKFIEKRNFGSALSIAANNEDIDVKTSINEEIPYDEYEKVQRIQDKSLSEFSTELMMSQGMSETENFRDKLGDKSVEHYATFKAQDKLIWYNLIHNYLMQFLIKYKEEDNEELLNDNNKIKALQKCGGGHLVVGNDSLYTQSIKQIKNRPHIAWLKDRKKSADRESAPLYLEEEFKWTKSPIDPKTLKDILKRSNGTSLSEILQQNNLSLTDLLNGKENAISALKPTYSLEDRKSPILEINSRKNHSDKGINATEIKTLVTNFEVYNRTDTTNIYVTTTVNPIINDKIASSKEKNIETTTYRDDSQDLQNNLNPKRNQTNITTKRRFPVGIRRKLRMKPAINYKAQLSRDIMPANNPKHLRNSTKLQEWKETVPLMVNTTFVIDLLVNKTSDSELTTTSMPRETILVKDITTSMPVILTTPNNFTNKQAEEDKKKTKLPEIVGTLTEDTDIVTSTETVYNVSQKPKVTPALRPLPKNVELRRQALNNRLKKKRLKQKDSTSESSIDTNKDLFGMTNLVSASEFIAKSQTPKTTKTELPTTLEDIPVTEIATKRVVINKSKSTRIHTTTKPSSSTSKITTTTEDTAKIEIEEILNDTLTSLKLAKILKERNMTLKELVQLRERGSSHVHLADIFHNASKEPNPPEPFLSKSLLEPISRETYPLRALLEANLHDPTAKATTIDPTVIEHLNIPIAMDFGNNVNENGETLGIMSLFNKVTENQDNKDQKAQIINNSIDNVQNGTITPTSIRANTTNIYDIIREGRTLDDNYQDMADWSEVLELLQKESNNESKSHYENPEGGLSTENVEKYMIDEVIDGDSLIILDNLPQSNEFEINTASRSDESLEANMHQRSKILTQTSGILSNVTSNTKSVTVAIAGIVGLSMVLFLLTYAVFKWRQQRKLLHKKDSVCGDRIPAPIFESRKGNKIHSSSRSLSPMIAPSNIYTMSTLDSHNERDSPDYMWDTLRKPFQ